MYTFTSESVSVGHPDKICDQISDGILDCIISQDKYAKVAVECFATTNYLLIGGEINTKCEINKDEINNVARNIIKNIDVGCGFLHDTIEIDNRIHEQSHDIAIGVDDRDDGLIGAGDQGIMFGFACDENDCYIPSSIMYSHKILENIYNGIQNKEIKGLRHDAKSQVSLIYKDQKPIDIAKIVLSNQHYDNLNTQDVADILMPIIRSSISPDFNVKTENVYINPTGRFVTGGPDGDAGLTGRKIIVDTYGGASAHGGGAFSGKDPTKVDRSAAYMMRYIAKNLVSHGYAKKVSIQISYCIGMSEPMSLYVNTYGTGKIDDDKICNNIMQKFDLSPKAIIDFLDLRRPIYKKTATFGHFGREYNKETGHFSWERVDNDFTL